MKEFLSGVEGGCVTLKPDDDHQLQIAIDGPAGAGKSTLAREVALKMNYLYIDTGAMYRAAAWLAIKNNLSLDKPAQIVEAVRKSHLVLWPPDVQSQGRIRVYMDDEDITTQIRSKEVTQLVSPLSAIPALREIMVERQRQIAGTCGSVLDGRDIGTVVLPNADLKIFLVASPSVRALRRQKELEGMGATVDLKILQQEIEQRDYQDSTRAVAPLRAAEDAITIDTDDMTIEEVVDTVLSLCKNKLKERV